MIGSSSTEPPFASASRIAARAAISNAMADESTSCEAPSISDSLISTTGKPAITPDVNWPSRPFSTAGMNSFGTDPPTMSFSNSKPTPGVAGSATILMRANWP